MPEPIQEHRIILEHYELDILYFLLHLFLIGQINGIISINLVFSVIILISNAHQTKNHKRSR